MIRNVVSSEDQRTLSETTVSSSVWADEWFVTRYWRHKCKQRNVEPRGKGELGNLYDAFLVNMTHYLSEAGEKIEGLLQKKSR